MNERKMNMAGWIAHVFVTSKLSILFMLTCVLLGLLAVALTPREENPQIIVPGAEIIVSLPGASSSDIEQLIINPLEAIIREIPGVDHTYAVAMNSLAIVTVQFEVGEDKEKSLVKLYDRVLGKQDQLPTNASPPLIKSIDVDDVPIVSITLASESYNDYALKRLADRMVERLRSLESISVSYVKGGRDREVRVELDPERLLAFGVTLNQIHAALKAGNLSVPMKTQVHQGKNSHIYLDAFLNSIQDVKKIIVAVHKNRPIYLEDVADVIDSPIQERNTLSRFTFGQSDQNFGRTLDPEIPAVSIAIAKKPGTNAVFVANEILERIERMTQNFVPEGVHVITTRNDGVKADEAVNNLIEHMGIAILSVFIVVILFLGLKEALIVGITVPMILGLTLGVNYLSGYTINRITLFALILSLGLLVDAAIVVIENIHRHYASLGMGNKCEATILATDEIGNPTNLATVAIMLVFLSLLMVSGMTGQYFLPIATNVTIAMFASLLVAYIVTPWAANRWLKPGEGHDLEDHNPKDKLHALYHWIILPLLKNRFYRYLSMLLILLSIILSILQPAWQFIRPEGVGGPLSSAGVALAFLPKDNKNTFNVTIDMPEFTPVEVTDQVARDVGKQLRLNPYIINYQTWIGSAGVIDFNGLLRGSGNKKGAHIAEIRVNLLNKKLRDVSSIDLVRELRLEIKDIQSRYPGSIIQLVEDPPGPPVRATVLAEIYGSDLSKLRKISTLISKKFKATFDMVEVHDTQVADVQRYNIMIDKEKAALSGVTSAEIAKVIQQLVNGDELGQLHIQDEKHVVPIRLHIPRQYQIDPVLLSRVFVSNRQGDKIPLSELTKVSLSWEDRPILHKDYERVTYVGGELVQTAPVYAVLDLDQRLDNMDIGQGDRLKTSNLRLESVVADTIDDYQLLWSGEIRLTLDTFRDMLSALGVALLFIYLLLVAYYRSFTIPLIAMSAIPLGLVGVFPGHWLMGQSFTATSMIGVIALAGVVVRNSLLIIDFVQDYMNKGMPLIEAISEAGAVRLRPILLTALAIILGSAVMLSDPVFGGLAISLIFGTFAATILTLIVVPMLFYSLLRRQLKADISLEKSK